MDASVIIVAAGEGKRIGAKLHKPFIKIRGKPILLYTLKKFSKLKFVKEIILVLHKDDIKKYLPKYSREFARCRVSKIVEGGKRRQDSVANGLSLCEKTTKYVIIHDGVRPFIDTPTIIKTFNTAKKTGAAIVASCATDTVKYVQQNIVKKTLNRSKIWLAQTPQIFRKQLLLKVVNKLKSRKTFTDESQILEQMGVKIRIVQSKNINLKVTTAQDLYFIKAAGAIFLRQ
jgi:2-C-methyl-D-erythritol 4-phosphate cytidylyltransferase